MQRVYKSPVDVRTLSSLLSAGNLRHGSQIVYKNCTLSNKKCVLNFPDVFVTFGEISRLNFLRGINPS